LRFRGGLVFEAHRLVYHSTLGLRVIKKKKSCGTKLPNDFPLSFVSILDCRGVLLLLYYSQA